MLDRSLIGVRVNLVVDSNGSFIGIDGSSRSLSNELDKQRLIELRKLSDVVITDAATARAEEYRPSKWVPIEVWSKSGNFAGVNQELALLHVGEISNEFARLERKAVLLETGPTLTRVIAALGLIDELALTVTGKNNSEMALQTALGALNRLGLGNLSLIDAETTDSTNFFTFAR